MSRPWDRSPQKRRRAGIRLERKKYLIVTEGHTEKAYLDHFKTSTKLQVIVENPDSTKQLSLVRRAKELRDERTQRGEFLPELDEVWVVFDRDLDPSNPNDLTNFQAAIRYAQENGMNVALSNDSFELWYLLHFQDVSSAMHRRDIDSKLTKHLGRTYKSRHASKVEDLYYLIKDKREDALKKAKRLHDACSKDGRSWENENPLTLIYLLIEKIMNEEGFREE